MAEYKRRFSDAPPVAAIVTDFAVHGFWIHRNIDRYVVATGAMRDSLLSRHVRPEAIEVSGIPVRPEFVRSQEPREALRERLDLPRDRYIVLLMGGGLGIAPLEGMLRALDAVRVPLAAVVVAGKNARIGRRLTNAAESVGHPVRVLRFVDNVYDYMHAADVLVTKPGGLSTAEALVAQVPLVLCKALPGQEERNARVLVEAGAAARASETSELPAMLEAILKDEDRQEKMIAAARHLARPNAASEAASMVARLVQRDKEVVA
jgi:processive 1,2-diacylglycerol beta-glucosyltransferase